MSKLISNIRVIIVALTGQRCLNGKVSSWGPPWQMGGSFLDQV